MCVIAVCVCDRCVCVFVCVSPHIASRLFTSACKRVCCSPIARPGPTPAKRVLESSPKNKTSEKTQTTKTRDNPLEPPPSPAASAPVPAPRVSEQPRGRLRALLSLPGLLLPPQAAPRALPPRRDPRCHRGPARGLGPVSPRTPAAARNPTRSAATPRPATSPLQPSRRPDPPGAKQAASPGRVSVRRRLGRGRRCCCSETLPGEAAGRERRRGRRGQRRDPDVRGAGPRARHGGGGRKREKGRARPGCRVERGPVGNWPRAVKGSEINADNESGNKCAAFGVQKVTCHIAEQYKRPRRSCCHGGRCRGRGPALSRSTVRCCPGHRGCPHRATGSPGLEKSWRSLSPTSDQQHRANQTTALRDTLSLS